MNNSLLSKVLKVSSATSISKIIGLLRQIFIASFFGIGIIYDAYNYSYIVPGFFLIIIGGINGPIHNATVKIITNSSLSEGRYLLKILNTKIFIFLILIALLVFFKANLFIDLFAPGLQESVKYIAINQLKIMSIIIPISGLLGIGYGVLNSKDDYFISSISPAITSLSIIIFIYFQKKFPEEIILLNRNYLLASATLLGVIFQYLVLINKLMQLKLCVFSFKIDFINLKIREAFKIIIPGAVSSSISQINLIIDLFFASNYLGAAAGLGYATFLIQAPLGIVSSSIIIPLFSTFTKLSNDQNFYALNQQFKKGLIYIIASMTFIAGIFISQNNEIIELVYKRGVFDIKAVTLVRNLLIAYSFGMPAYLCRDYIVRLYYSLGRANIPFRSSIFAIFLNAILDWILTGAKIPNGQFLQIDFGVIGIVISSNIVNYICCIYLALKLENQFRQSIINIIYPFIKIIFSVIISAIIAYELPKLFLFRINSIDHIYSFPILSIIYCLIFFILTKKFLRIKLF